MVFLHFKQIFQFYSLVLIAIWLDMITLLFCVLALSIRQVLSADYLKDATQKGLDYVRKVGIPYMEKEIKSVKVPDINGETITPVGKIEFGLSNITFEDVSIPKSNMTINEKTGLTVSCNNATLHFTSKWRYREKSWPHIRDSGTMNVQMERIHLDISFYINSKDEKKPQVETSTCDLDIGNLKLHFNGGASWLYNLFADRIGKDLKDSVAKMVCSEVSKVIDREGDKLLLELPEVMQTIKTRIALYEKENLHPPS